jgi:hypothetical protein
MEPCTKDSDMIIDSAQDVGKNNSVTVLTSNPKVLGCCICLQPLSIPLFQVYYIQFIFFHLLF